MPRNIYSELEKRQAVNVYIAQGRKEAERQTGIKGKTIGTWVSRRGLAPAVSAERQVAIAGSKEEVELRRERIKAKLATQTEWALDMMGAEFEETIIDQRGGEHKVTQKPKPADVKNYAMTVGILFDKLQLATGGVTSNTQVLSPLELEAIKAQHAKNAQEKADLAQDVQEKAASLTAIAWGHQ